MRYERRVDLEEELFGQPFLNVDALEQTGEAGGEDGVHVVRVVDPNEGGEGALV